MKNEDVQNIISIVAHDLKNPLSAIQSLTDLLLSDFENMDNKDVREMLQMVAMSANHMFDLVDGLLNMQAIEEGRIRVNLEKVNILPNVKYILKNYQQKADKKQINLHFEAESDSYLAIVDVKKLLQILDNLISNALKYSPFGKNVYVRLTQDPAAVRLIIQDEGPGLSAEDKALLFRKFMRLTPQPTAQEHSTGVGLYIVKQLVLAMRGNVWCETELGQGASFVVEFPSVMTEIELKS